MADPRARFAIAVDDRATKALKSIRGEVGGLNKAFKTLAVALPVGAFVASTRAALNYADSIADAAERTDFSARALQELKFQAAQNGVAFRELEAGLGRFTKRLGLARAGTGAAAKTYEQLGINLGQTNEQVFRQVVATLGDIDDATNRLALATRLFGDDAQRLGVVFAGGEGALDNYAKRAAELGLILSDDLVQGASDANDQLEILQQVLQVQLTRGLVQLAPLITKVGQAFAEAAGDVARFFNSFDPPGQQSLDVAIDQLDKSNARLAELRERLVRANQLQDPALRRQFPAQGSEILGGLLGSFDRDKIRAQIEREQELNLQLQARLIELQNQPPPVAATASAVDTAALFGGGGGGSAKATRKAKTRRDVEEPLDEAVAIYKEKLQQLERVVADVDPLAPLLDQRASLEELGGFFPEYADIIEQALFDVEDEIDRVNNGLVEQKDQVEKTRDAWQSLGPVFESAFEDAIVSGAKLSDVLEGLEQDILRIITRKAITEPLGNFIGGQIGAQGSLFQSLFGFAQGGSFTVGGSGGVDSQVVAFRATPGERVDVKTPRQQSAGAVYNFNFTLPADTPNYRKTGQMVAREAARFIQTSQGQV